MRNLQQLLSAISKGDKAAFEALYEDLKKPLFTVIWRITRNQMLSEDVLQEVFVKIYLTPPDANVNPRAYLYHMAHNLAVDSLRKHRLCTNLEETQQSVCSSSATDTYNDIGLEDAIFTLAQKERQIVTLHINGELKFREIADITGIPLGTVLWTYQKAIKKLQALLGDIL